MPNQFRNSGFDNMFTCPACHSTFDVDGDVDKVSECPNCSMDVVCTVEHDPVAVCTIVGKAAKNS